MLFLRSRLTIHFPFSTDNYRTDFFFLQGTVLFTFAFSVGEVRKCVQFFFFFVLFKFCLYNTKCVLFIFVDLSPLRISMLHFIFVLYDFNKTSFNVVVNPRYLTRFNKSQTYYQSHRSCFTLLVYRWKRYHKGGKITS